MRQFLKRLFVVVTLTVVTQSSFVSAAGIRVIGPSGRVQDAPEYNLPMNQEPSQFYGPTTANETLWSIASKLRPSNQVSVQQTLLAIFELNPGVFENQNIHSLIPRSTIRVPSLAQVRSVTTEQAVAVMKVHQARLDNEAAGKRSAPKTAPKPAIVPPVTQATKTDTSPQETIKPIPSPVVKEQNTDNSLQSKLAEISKPDTPVVTTLNETDKEELLALEEKNHRLMLMLSKVQAEVDNLKNNLDDETRVRSEVEKLLIEEKRKNEEAAKLAPSTLDKLLSKWWFIGGIGLIPGALIAYLITLFIRRSGGKDEADEVMTSVQEQPEPANAGAGEIPSDSVDDLMFDDDLFSVGDDEETDDVNTDDVFAELDDSDLSISLDDENDEEDPFAAVGDDGDFIGIDIDDTLSTESSNGISVNADDKAIGLEEMEKALDEAANDLDDDFDLFNETKEDEDSIISQDDIQSLLSGAEDLDTSDEDSSDNDDQETGESSSMGLGNAPIASDSDIENLFNSIESQVDLEELENSAVSEEDYNLDSDDDIIEDELSLLDELVDADEETEEDTDWDKELDELSGFDLSSDDFDDDLFSTSPSPVEKSGNIDSSDEIDELGELLSDIDDDSDDTDSVVDPELSVEPIDDGTEFLDELIEIEKNAQDDESESMPDKDSGAFNSNDFLDDLLDSVPENDPLLDDMDLDGNGPDVEFDFNPEIEGHDSEEDTFEPEISEVSEIPEEVKANEFGVPQDEDWDIAEEPPELDETELPEFSEEEALVAVEPEELAEPAEEIPLEEPEAEEVLAEEPPELDETELPEFSEEEALVAVEPEELAEPAEEIPLEEPEAEEVQAEEPLELDETELPKFSEEEALAAVEPEELAEPVEEIPLEEPEAEEVLAEEPAELDETELPEFSEEEALAAVEPEELAEPEEEIPLEEPEEEEVLAEESHIPTPDEELFEEFVALANSPLSEAESTIPETNNAQTDVASDEEPQAPTADEELFDEFVALAEPSSETAKPEEENILDEEISLDDVSEPDLVEEEVLNESDLEEESFDEQIQDSELPEFNEEDAFDSYDDEAESDTELLASVDEQNERFEFEDDELPSFDENELLDEQAPTDTGSVDNTSESGNYEDDIPRAAIDEKALDELLSDDDSAEHYSLSATMDDEFIDSGGMNIDSMLEDLDGEDWNGFKLSPEQQSNISVDIPDDEQDIWRDEIQTVEPELEDENWSTQENVVDDDPKDKRYMTIDELMAQVDAEGGEFEEQDLKLDVGLNEFPDVIGNISDIDVDSNAEATGKLDLAKIYMEMNDDQGAIKLLEEAIVDGDDNIRRQAKHLIDQINRDRS